MEADIGLIGLAVMGQNLVLNLSDHGYHVAVFNRTTSKVDEFLSTCPPEAHITGAYSLEEFFQKLKRPRKVMLMVKAGDPVDHLIEECLPFLEKGDILIDGGNSLYTDTERRVKDLESKGILFLGVGVSGGEEGARNGPSMMPGGSLQAWPVIKPMFQTIAAQADDLGVCCDWIGSGGSGHYVKMVHNGIEYGDMQLISEAYYLLKEVANCSPIEISDIFTEWNTGKLNSYLIEITAAIFQKKDHDGSLLIDNILDTAGQKGTGKWTGMSALELGVPVTLIAESVFARYLSSFKDERASASHRYQGAKKAVSVDKKAFIHSVMQALYASKIVSYAQGFMLMQTADQKMKWDLNYETIARVWKGGCIIRSQFLEKIEEAFANNKKIKSLLLDPFFHQEIMSCLEGWRSAVSIGIQAAAPIPALASALTFFDGYTTERLPANLIQAQRDFFGAHTYERIDRPRGEFFHTQWS